MGGIGGEAALLVVSRGEASKCLVENGTQLFHFVRRSARGNTFLPMAIGNAAGGMSNGPDRANGLIGYEVATHKTESDDVEPDERKA